MFRLPTLEYGLSHPHPKGHWFLLATLIVFLVTLPALILVNLATLGYNLVPSLQPHFQSNHTLLERWWSTRRLPAFLHPRSPACEPKDLGRGDAFRLSGSLFDYTVMSTWNTTEGPKPSGIQEQRRVEYRGESFANCYVNAARFDYSLGDQAQSVTVGVLCPGYEYYPVEVSMQTTITFAWELSKDFIGQYYGPELALLGLNDTNPTDYRKVVLAVLEVISADALTIMRKQHLSEHPLSMRVVFGVDPDTAEPIPSASTLTYINGSQPDQYPEEARIYEDTVYNLVAVTIDAVNLDLGSYRSPNAFRNASRLAIDVAPNLAPAPIRSADWAQGSQTFYYGALNLTRYQTWAQALLDGYPVRLGNLTGLPDESVMTTMFLCPTYQIKPISSLLASVFVGSATMTLSVWSVWMAFTTFLARQITKPQVICHCRDCEARREKEAEEGRRREANPASNRFFAWLMAPARRSNPTERAPNPPQEHGIVFTPLEYDAPRSGHPTQSPDAKHASYQSTSTSGGKQTPRMS